LNKATRNENEMPTTSTTHRKAGYDNVPPSDRRRQIGCHKLEEPTRVVPWCVQNRTSEAFQEKLPEDKHKGLQKVEITLVGGASKGRRILK
jgi:hypothetical protein